MVSKGMPPKAKTEADGEEPLNICLLPAIYEKPKKHQGEVNPTENTRYAARCHLFCRRARLSSLHALNIFELEITVAVEIILNNLVRVQHC